MFYSNSQKVLTVFDAYDNLALTVNFDIGFFVFDFPEWVLIFICSASEARRPEAGGMGQMPRKASRNLFIDLGPDLLGYLMPHPIGPKNFLNFTVLYACSIYALYALWWIMFHSSSLSSVSSAPCSLACSKISLSAASDACWSIIWRSWSFGLQMLQSFALCCLVSRNLRFSLAQTMDLSPSRNKLCCLKPWLSHSLNAAPCPTILASGISSISAAAWSRYKNGCEACKAPSTSTALGLPLSSSTCRNWKSRADPRQCKTLFRLVLPSSTALSSGHLDS